MGNFEKGDAFTSPADALGAARSQASRESAHVSIQESWDNYITQFPGVLFSADDHSLYDAGYRAALEAAQRPPVSPEQREAVRAVVGEQLTRAGLDLDGPPYSDDGETQWPVALELRDRLTDALLARFTIPVLDTDNMRAEK